MQICTIYQHLPSVGSNRPISKSTVVLLPLPVLPINQCVHLDGSPDPAPAAPQVDPLHSGNEQTSRRMPSRSGSGFSTNLRDRWQGLIKHGQHSMNSSVDDPSTTPNHCKSVAKQATSVARPRPRSTQERNYRSTAAPLQHQANHLEGNGHHAHSLEVHSVEKLPRKSFFSLKLALRAIRLAVNLEISGLASIKQHITNGTKTLLQRLELLN